MTSSVSSERSYFQTWKRWRRSHRFPYILSAAILLLCGLWQVYLYWWGVQLQRKLDQRSVVERLQIFPRTWRTRIDSGYPTPLEPITKVCLTNRDAETAWGLRDLNWLLFLETLACLVPMTEDDWVALSKLQQVRSLKLYANATESRLAYVGKLQGLKELSLRVNPEISVAGIRQIVGLSRLRKLRIEFEGRVASVPSNSSRGQIVPLRIEDIAQSRRGLTTAEDQLHELARSRTLARLQATLNDSTLLALTDFIPGHQYPLLNLTELRLERSPVTNAGLVNLSHFPNLVHLDISQSKIDDEGLVSLKSIPRLRTLYLAGCRGITDQGADQLAGLTGLESLNVADTQLTEAGLLKLGKLKRLRELRLSPSFVVSPGLRLELSPNCRIKTR
jgi:hypothetical protein